MVMADPPVDVRRIRGVIDQDETWSGTILITDDTSIDGATVTVVPGTVIEFAGGDPARHPVLTVGSERLTLQPPREKTVGRGDKAPKIPATNDIAGRLVMVGSRERPIVFRTAAGSGPGRILVVVRNRIVTTTPENPKDFQTPRVTTKTPDELQWRFVRFEQLGYTESRTFQGKDIAVRMPGVTVELRPGGQTARLEDCEFARCHRLSIQTDDHSTAIVARCVFRDSAERTDVDIAHGPGAPPPRGVRIADNRFAAALADDAAPAEINGNIGFGPTAAIVIRDAAGPGVTVAENYVHCTAREDDGRYVLNCESPDTHVLNNVFIGGTNTVQNGSRRMSDNVFIGAGDLTGVAAARSRTHRVIANLPASAVFERNVVLGPAFSLLAPQPGLAPRFSGKPAGPGATATVVRHNAFDGLDGVARAAHLTLPKRIGGSVEFYSNLILRCGAVAFDPTGDTEALAYADHNALIGGMKQPFDRAAVVGKRPGEDGWSAHDVRAADPAAAGLGALPARSPDFDTDLSSGRVTIAEVRAALFAPYRPRDGSPLIGAGRPLAESDGAASNIGPAVPPEKP